MSLSYNVPENKKIRVIIDTDAACEADDPFAIAHALMCRKFDVKGICAEQFNEPRSVRKSYDEIGTVLSLMKLDVPFFMGEDGALKDIPEGTISPAAEFIISEAEKDGEGIPPLYLLCLGAITNVASAIRKKPAITAKMNVIWIGGQDYENVRPDFREFNAGNDIEAINLVISSGVKFTQIPVNVYGAMRISLAEIQDRIAPCGDIGKHLFENMTGYNMTDRAFWTAGESWSIGDSPAVGIALDPDCGRYIYRKPPVFNDDTTYAADASCNDPGFSRKIKVYTSVDSRFIIEDLIAKLRLLYCPIM